MPAIEPSRRELGQRGEFHRGHRRVSGDGGEDADADREPLGSGERGGGQARGGRVETVLDHPQLVEPVGLQALRRLDDEPRREFPWEAHAEVRVSGRSHPPTVDDRA